MSRIDVDKSELRAVFANRQLRKTRFDFPYGNVGVFMKVTLAIIYMYLILISYTWMGTAGVVVISVLFLAALSLPMVIWLVKNYRSKRDQQEILHTKEAKQEG